MHTAFMIWAKIQALILANPTISIGAFIYNAAAMVSALNEKWDGFYNWFYRYTHILMNARIVQEVESKIGPVTVAPAASSVVIKETK